MEPFTPCDACGQRSYVHVILDTGLPLSFCSHHFDTNEEALAAYVIAEDDQRSKLHHQEAT